MPPVPAISEYVRQQFVSILGIKSDRVVTLLEGSRPVELSPGDTLFLQGDPATAIYFLISGELSVCLEDGFGCSEIASLREGSVVGELALLSGEQRTATVTAITATVVLEVAFTDFFALGLHHPAMIVGFFERVMPRLRETRKVELVRKSFGVPDPAWNMAIARRMTWRTRGKDEVVVERGDEADGLYLIVSGRLAVLSDGADAMTSPVILLPGDIVGEMAVIDDLPRSATVVALRPSDLLFLSKKDFAELMGDEPKALLHLVRILVSRERRRRSGSSSAGHGSIALIPSGPVPLDAITARAPKGAVLVDRTRLAQRFGSEAFADLPGDHALAPVVRRWIEDLEASTDTLYLLGDGRGGGWDGLCRELADRTVAIQAAEDLSAETPVARERIVVTAESVAAAAASLPESHVSAEADDGAGPIHYYVYDRASSARAWRVLSSTAHGVVLSGGGARGFAHIGVLRLLEELGQPVDTIGGTSIGALLGALYALHGDASALTEIAASLSRNRRILDYTLPLASLFRSKKLGALLEELYGSTRIEELPLPFFAVSTDLTRARVVVHYEGKLIDAVRRSISIPGIFYPVVRHGRIFVDGGIMNNLPTDVMTGRPGIGYVTASDVSKVDTNRRHAYAGYQADDARGIAVLMRRLRYSRRPHVHVPELGDIILRTFEVNSAARFRAHSDRVSRSFRLDLSGFNPLDFGNYRAIIEEGYRQASEQLG